MTCAFQTSASRAPSGRVRLLGVASRFLAHPDEVTAPNRIGADAQTRIGEAAFAAAWETDRTMTWDGVLAEVDALAAAAEAAAGSRGGSATQRGLSCRELDVL